MRGEFGKGEKEGRLVVWKRSDEVEVHEEAGQGGSVGDEERGGQKEVWMGVHERDECKGCGAGDGGDGASGDGEGKDGKGCAG